MCFLGVNQAAIFWRGIKIILTTDDHILSDFSPQNLCSVMFGLVVYSSLRTCDSLPVPLDTLEVWLEPILAKGI